MRAIGMPLPCDAVTGTSSFEVAIQNLLDNSSPAKIEARLPPTWRRNNRTFTHQLANLGPATLFTRDASRRGDNARSLQRALRAPEPPRLDPTVPAVAGSRRRLRVRGPHAAVVAGAAAGRAVDREPGRRCGGRRLPGIARPDRRLACRAATRRRRQHLRRRLLAAC